MTLGLDIDRARLVRRTQAFVQHRSEQTDLLEAEPAVRQFIDQAVAPVLRDHFIAPRFDDMGNLLATLGPEPRDDCLAFVTYAMTHPAASMVAPFDGDVVDTPNGPAVRGRGVCEQKAALAAALEAFLAAACLPAERPLAFIVLTSGETGRHDAVAAAVQALGVVPSRAVVAIGTDNKVSLGNRGRVDFDVVAGGLSCHSSTPWLGRNAIDAVGPVLDWAAAQAAGLGADPDLGPATLTPTAIRTAPEATHTIPSDVRITFDRRLIPGEQPGPVMADLKRSLAGLGLARVGIEPGPIMHACQLAADSPFVALIQAAVADADLGQASLCHSQSALDAGFFAHHGASAVMWGPGHPDLFHSADERVGVDDIVWATRAYLAVMDAWATGDRP